MLRTRGWLVVASIGALGVVSAAGAGQPPIAGLNHFLAVLDDATAEAVKNAAYLKEFANFSVNTVAANGGQSWTGRYLLGRQTYVELFAVHDLEQSGRHATVGDSSIGIGGDKPGAVSILVERLRAAGITARTGMRKRRFGDREVDWFKSANIETPGPQSHSGAFALEYVASYFDEPASGKTEPPEGPDDIVSRERYNSDEYKNHLMRDVRSVELAITPVDSPPIEAMLRAAGFDVKKSTATVRAIEPDIEIVLRLVPETQIGLRRVEFLLNTGVKTPHVEQIGHSVLKVGPGDRAVWTFTVPCDGCASSKR